MAGYIHLPRLFTVFISAQYDSSLSQSAYTLDPVTQSMDGKLQNRPQPHYPKKPEGLARILTPQISVESCGFCFRSGICLIQR
jgi:hypothetical protein